MESLGIERGHRTLVITRKGGKVVTIPLVPCTARAIGKRVEGPIYPLGPCLAVGAMPFYDGRGQLCTAIRRFPKRDTEDWYGCGC